LQGDHVARLCVRSIGAEKHLLACASLGWECSLLPLCGPNDY